MTDRPEDRYDWPERLEELARRHSHTNDLAALIREAKRARELDAEVASLKEDVERRDLTNLLLSGKCEDLKAEVERLLGATP